MDPIIFLIKKNRRLALRLLTLSKFNKKKKVPFLLDEYDDEQCLSLFRFTAPQIRLLRSLFRIPWKIKCQNGAIFNGVEALCILLRRMSYPNRLFDLTLMFKRTKEEICVIFNHVLNHILGKFGHLLAEFNLPWLTRDKLVEYAAAVVRKGAPLNKCWGFIDGTVRPMCRPSRHQKECYNGHKRVHALKYQSVVIPNGLVANLSSPIEKRRHDSYMLSESGLLPKLESINLGEIDPFYLYGDPAYPIRMELQGPYKGSHLTPEQAEFNKRMSVSRISVEWTFGKILSLWAFVDFKKNQRVFLQPLAKYFKMAVLLTNVHTCIYGSQTSMFFNMVPPDVENYLIPINE